mgnify:CR=1 FL=1
MNKIETRLRRKKTVRKKVFGSKSKPRVSVFRSNKHIYAQAINDYTGETLASVNDKKIKGSKAEKATEVGKKLGELLSKKEIEQAVFDRNGYKYHGRVAALANGLREAGIKL